MRALGPGGLMTEAGSTPRDEPRQDRALNWPDTGKRIACVSLPVMRKFPRAQFFPQFID